MNIFYTPDIQGNQYILSESESKHCIRVLRHKMHDSILLVDGKGGRFIAQIIDANPKKCAVQITQHESNFGKRDFYLHVAIAPTKNTDRFEWFLEKATEFGVDEITPLLCENSERKQLKPDRLEKVIISAMKQSLKAYRPKLNNLTNFDAFVKNADIQNRFIAHCKSEEKKHLMLQTKPGTKMLIMVGPEGDFSDCEIEYALKNQFHEISLGNSRLRTETAGVAAVHIVNIANDIV